ncbi:hypothetical protein [Acaryochloris marina]|uniref:Uncharacterized protein n=1 Tax=Acaryochloris marina (strain MBIC 11017) TaxID=329726 RepID=B0C284_ACAM1|nr:hypothetical protein [Acaryochloris marina]ABW28536.1 conserved hypothetical protein [Acaryochloris marina MBIC11017]BDM77535.1 hypothetical protein AM10699_04090 [Acaryochloris marina MBIC10699]
MTIHRPTSQAGLAALLALGICSAGVAPLMQALPVQAQSFPRSSRVALRSGTVIPAAYQGAERIILKPDETLPVTLTVVENVRNSRGTILIPRGSRIAGQLEPSGDGSQFVANTLILTNRERQDIDATSDVITRREEIRKGNNDRIWQGALVGGAAAGVLAEIFGDAGVLEVLGGAGAGALGGWLLGRREKVEVVVIDAKQDLDLTLDETLALR